MEFLLEFSLLNFKHQAIMDGYHGYHPPIGLMVTESLLPGQTGDKNAKCIGLHYCNGPNNCYKLFSLQIFPTENGLYLVGLNLTIATAA